MAGDSDPFDLRGAIDAMRSALSATSVSLLGATRTPS